MRRPTRALAVALASAALLSACASDPEGGAAATSSPAESSSAASPSSEAPPAAGGGTVLTGSVGTPDDPEAFVIALTDADGEPVESLPAGDYTIEVDDPSVMHNFHLIGGEVDETTSVPEKTTTTFEVTFAAGEYTIQCDPHPKMKSTFTVT